MGKIGKTQVTDYSREKEYAKSNQASSPKEIVNKKGQAVILYNRGDSRFAISFDKSGKEIKHTVFGPDHSEYTEQKNSTGSIMSFGTNGHTKTKQYFDANNKFKYAQHFDKNGNCDANEYE